MKTVDNVAEQPELAMIADVGRVAVIFAGHT